MFNLHLRETLKLENKSKEMFHYKRQKFGEPYSDFNCVLVRTSGILVRATQTQLNQIFTAP